MANCKGPCLNHCYYKYAFIFVLLGILGTIGYQKYAGNSENKTFSSKN